MIGDFVKAPCPECGAPGKIIPTMTISRERIPGGLAVCSNGHQFRFNDQDTYKLLVDPHTAPIPAMSALIHARRWLSWAERKYMEAVKTI